MITADTGNPSSTPVNPKSCPPAMTELGDTAMQKSEDAAGGMLVDLA